MPKDRGTKGTWLRAKATITDGGYHKATELKGEGNSTAGPDADAVVFALFCLRRK